MTPGVDLTLDDAVRAMGHPGRRAMLRLARDTGLMHMRVDAKRRLYRVNLERLDAVRAALEDLWGDRLDALKSAAESQPTPRRSSKASTA